MSRNNTLAGQKFGNLVAVEATSGRKNGYTIWRCVCDCGRTAEIASRSLKNGWTTTCGDSACKYAAKEQKKAARPRNAGGTKQYRTGSLGLPVRLWKHCCRPDWTAEGRLPQELRLPEQPSPKRLDRQEIRLADSDRL